uniref:ankyrin repeat and SOCS box protein 2-like n=1 Tax=Ciona intestinalis TaxID=7719 RepID=UPI000180ADB3
MDDNIRLFPITIQEEERQLRLALLQSLEESLGGISDESEDGASEDESSRGGGKDQTRSSRSTAYTRSNTIGVASPSTSYTYTDTSPQSMLRRSMSIGGGSPPRPTLKTDCCEVKNALLVRNKEYIQCLVTSWGRVTSPLHAAVRKGHDYCLEALLKAFPDLVNSTNTNGETPLYLAAIHSKVRAAKKLIEYEADPNIGRNTLETPLVAAVDNDNREMALCLIKGGADVNKSLNRGWTALHEAVYRGHTQVLELLLAKGGNPNTRDGFGISPVFTSAACGRSICLEMLLIAGGDPNLCAKSKSASPLYEACKEGHVDCVIRLLRHGADPHLVNCDG